jgi:hypothetical protein
MLLVLLGLLVVGGCAKPMFTIVDKRLCKKVDGAGKPLEETTTFSPNDGRVCVWFSYKNAGAGQTVKAKFTHVDPLGTQSSEQVECELKAGTHSGVAELTGQDGGPLAPGKYTVELANQSDVGYGPPLDFTVQ